MSLAPKPGDIVPLRHSKEAAQRILVGLKWDPKSEEGGFSGWWHTLGGVDIDLKPVLDGELPKAGTWKIPLFYASRKRHTLSKASPDETYNLDLSCYAFDKDHEFITQVTPDNFEMTDESGSIYHSGDDFDGGGGHDDEVVYIELKNLPENIKQMFFVIESKNVHLFNEEMNPMCRIADSMTEETLLTSKIEPQEDKNYNAFIFARIMKVSDGWKLQNISKYDYFGEVTNVKEELSKYF